uniref:Uncharacterized protein n=1 Tax=Anguilla anguilla TaxID=7936 RepID=A0A0E9W9M3_ANGAN
MGGKTNGAFPCYLYNLTLNYYSFNQSWLLLC